MVHNVCMVYKDSIWMNDDGCLATTHRDHDLSPILPHVVADSTWSHYTFSQGRLTWYLYVVNV